MSFSGRTRTSLHHSSVRCRLVAVFAAVTAFCSTVSAGTWTQLTNNAPGPVNLLIQLSDGTVMASANDDFTIGNGWYKLTPDIHGSYVNGTWTTLASMNDTRLFYSSQLMQNGQLFVAGGEYGSGGGAAEVYDPVANTWTPLSIPTTLLDPNALSPIFGSSGTITQAFYDSVSEITSSGKVLICPVFPKHAGDTLLYDPAVNMWSAGPSIRAGLDQDEASWVKLADDSILTINSFTTSTERYIPATNSWVSDAPCPVQIYDNVGGEMGAALLLPSGKAFFMGATGHTAIYTPSGSLRPGTWVAGPDLPNGQVTADAPAAVLRNGNVLIAVSPPLFLDEFQQVEYPSPTTFFEYDPVANTFTPAGAPGGGSNDDIPSFQAIMLDLPDGSVLYSHFNTDLYIYTPSGAPLPAGKPTISSITLNGDGTSYHLIGTGLNGLSEGAGYGDDAQMNSNYPLVRATDGSGNFIFARTYLWSSTGVQTGNQVVTTEYKFPSAIAGQYTIQVLVNGFISDPFPSSSITAASGACCSESGNCALSSASGCTGVYFSGSGCAPTPCDSLGACCSSVGVCSLTTSSQCSGAFLVGGFCTPNPCTQPLGACCYSDGWCNIVTPSNCPGTWTSVGPCNPNPCAQLPSGACCDNANNCTINLRTDCTGSWQVSRLCAPNPCSDPLGACCAGSAACVLVTQTACTGTWTLGGTCFPNPCPQASGACCASDGSCQPSIRSACSGPWAIGGACSPNPCAQPDGTCCAANGTCQFITHTSCTGTWTLAGSCTPNPCPPPTGACCSSLGDCSVLTSAACASAAGVYKGDATTCTNGICPAVCPTITTQPLAKTLCSGRSANLKVVASGTAPLTYQWRKNQHNISGATSSTLALTGVSSSDAANYDCVVTNTCGSATSSAVTVAVNTPPVISVQPQSASLCTGAPVTLSVRAPGAIAKSFQWRKNAVNISGATANNFTIFSPQTTDAGNYDCVVTNACGSTTSSTAVLSVNAGVPTVTVQPQPLTICAGSTATFRLRAPGPGKKTFQWRKNGVDISGANGNVFTINSAALGDSGRYICLITNSCGTTRSQRVALSVTDCTHGACCDSNHACTVTSQSACANTWTADGTCSPNPCLVPGLAVAREAISTECVGQWLPDIAAPSVDGTIYAAAAWKPSGDPAQPGFLVVAGQFGLAGSAPASNIAAWDGAAWHTLDSGLNGPVYALMQFDGQLIAAGNFTAAGSTSCNSIAAWDGAAWHPLGAGLNTAATSLAEFNGDLVVGGSFSIAGSTLSPGVALWDGENWQPIGAGIAGGTVTALSVYNGSLVAAGDFTSPTQSIASWDGAAWHSLGNGFTGPVSALTVLNGQLVAAGSSTINSWNGSDWTPLGSGVAGTVRSLTVYRGSLVAAGDFTSLGGVTTSSIAQWNAASWRPLNAGVIGAVNTLAVYADTLTAAGGLTSGAGPTSSRVARWISSAPAFAQQPQNQSPRPGGAASFSVGDITSLETATVQWYHDGLPLSGSDSRVQGAASTTLTISPVQPGDTGAYTAMATSACATISSQPAVLSLCIADFNGSGTITVDDVFAFCSAWFARSPAADVNDDGSVNVQDIFDFLAAWFGRCP